MSSGDGWSDQEVRTRDGLVLPMSHRPPAGDREGLAVVCLHGASAWSDTFRVPEGNSLADALHRAGHSVWLPNWRGSMKVVPTIGSRKSNLDVAAELDLPAIFEHVRAKENEAGRATWRVAVVAHCLGSAALHVAIAGGHLTGDHIAGPVVCSTIGLFFVAPWDGWLKAADHVLVRTIAEHPEVRYLHPGARDGEPGSWPAPIAAAYDIWPDALLPPANDPDTDPDSVEARAHDLFRRVAFMFGRPYRAENVDEAIHGEELLNQFGPMDMGIYMHGTQAIRRGHVSPMDAPASGGDEYLQRHRFAPFRLSYFTGHRNELWHRDSVDRMVAWLRRPGGPKRVHKEIFHGYAHQDLYWGRRAHEEVLPRILEWLADGP